MTGTILELLATLRDGLEAVYADRLRGVYVYGSHAREEADRESDLDVLIVLDRIDAYGAEINRISELVSDLSLDHGLSVSRVFVSQKDWDRGTSIFLKRARCEVRTVSGQGSVIEYSTGSADGVSQR